MYKRKINISLPKGQSAFLWGARQTGKSTYLKDHFPDSPVYDFLLSDIYLYYLKEPHRLREELIEQNIAARNQPVILDEVQKIPLLLDEVHWLIENEKISFLLCGSSARKLKREKANLLGGRAWRYEMRPLTYTEVPEFNLLRALQQGLVPSHYDSSHPEKAIRAYVNDYLTEEIKAEGLSRNLAAFAKFLEAAAFSHGQLVEYKNIASDCGVDAKTVKEYFEILKDTYIASSIEPLCKKRDRKTISATPKFYFFDTGVANYLSKTKILQLKGAQAGLSFESYLFHEISTYREYSEKRFDINYWRTTMGHEVDFVLNEDEVYIEAKISDNIKMSDLKGLRQLLMQTPARQAYVVCLEKRPRLVSTPEGKKIHIIPWHEFLSMLWNNDIVS
ncbi:MAG: ATP-binding protein [Deltaproteobacteria bacterium]|nr:ATP-binding protein [Deltaproteobacteria bacterium]